MAVEKILADIDVDGSVIVSGTVDGIDVAFRDAVLTSTTTTAGNALPKAGGTITGDVIFGDNVLLKFGNGTDFVLKHDGTNSFFTNNSGDFKIKNNANNKDILFQCDDGSNGVTTYLKLDGSTTTLVADVPLVANRKYEIPSSTVGDYSGGDVVYTGTGTTIKGSIYYLKSTGAWYLADADTVEAASGMLAVALGTDSDVDGMLLRGFVTLLTEVEGTEALGSTLYLSTTAGVATVTQPSGSGDVVRVLGYSLHATNNQVYFNPDGTFVEVA